MAANYDTQLLALVAAAAINADGTTAITYGCAITRTNTGLYTLVLPTGMGIIDEQSFTRITPKASVTNPAQPPVVVVASDLSDNLTKQISCFLNSDATLADCGLEIVVQRTATYPLDTTTPPF